MGSVFAGVGSGVRCSPRSRANAQATAGTWGASGSWPNGRPVPDPAAGAGGTGPSRTGLTASTHTGGGDEQTDR